MIAELKKPVAFVVSVPGAIRHFLQPHFRALAVDYDLTVYCNFEGAGVPPDLLALDVTFVDVDIRREIMPSADLRALIDLTRAFARTRPVLVHSLLPKSGLLAMWAAWLAKVPNRVHTFTGQVWVTRRGLSRQVLKSVDWFIGWLATVRITDSPSQRTFLIREGVVKDPRVFGDGSICGVDGARFAPNPDVRAAARAEMELDDDQFLVGFVGRLNRDKGVLDLVEAFRRAKLPANARLVIVGPDEEGIATQIAHDYSDEAERIIVTGPVSGAEKILPAFDLFCLPSYREGFGSSALEASACEIPVLASRIYGLTDAVVEGKTGWMHPSGDVDAIARGLELAFADKIVREAMGKQGRQRVLRDFKPSRIVMAQRALYRELIADDGDGA